MTAPRVPSGKVIIGGVAFQTDAPIVNFREPPFWDARSQMCMPTLTDPNPNGPHSPFGGCTMHGPGEQMPYGKMPVFYADWIAKLGHVPRYLPRPQLVNAKWKNGEEAPYDAAKAVIKQFVIHHDGCASADMCWSVLQNERGLSVHFLCDNDGFIYQTLDLALMGFHAGPANPNSIGVELCNRGDARAEPTYYSKRGMTRPRTPCKINNHGIDSYDYTEAQYDAMHRLSRALLRLLPNIPAEYPQSSPGVQTWDTIPKEAQAIAFQGYIGHYHLTDRKWDPGPFDFKKYCQKIRGAFCFPLFPRGVPEKDQIQPVVPEQTEALKASTNLLYQLNEAKADGGFFPVGPWGEQRLWHGGVHLAAKERDSVFAPFPGRLVAARMGAPTAIGSVNFVLMKHQMSLGDRKLEFFSLFMHLADEAGTQTPVDWLVKARTDRDGKPRNLPSGEVWLLDEPIEAGSTIGHVGRAGPDDLSRAQVHVELFAISDLFEGVPNSPWEIVDGTGGGRFCDSARINDLIDTNHDGILSKPELAAFYTSGGGSAFRYLVTRHVSEWTNEPSWSESLQLSKDFKTTMKPDKIDTMVAEQITPGLWWDERVAAHCRLPPDGVVYHYNPVSFVGYLNQQLVDAAALAGPREIKQKDTGDIPPGITDDFGDKEGRNMRSATDSVEDPCNEKLTLKDLVLGFDAPECP